MNFIPLKITYFPNGQYLVVSGSNKQCLLLSHDGIQLATIGTSFSSWTWSCTIHPESTHVVSIVSKGTFSCKLINKNYFQAIGCQDGTITNLELSWNIVHGLYRDRYAYRENMTDVIIQHLITNQKVRIKCKDLVGI